MSQLPRQVPWLNWQEWDSVKDAFFATEDSTPMFAKRCSALHMVSLWRSRGGALPHSIESTATLAEIHMMDTISCSAAMDTSVSSVTNAIFLRNSEMSLRLQYTLAIIRCVNGLVDSDQQGVFAESVLSLALRRGIPAWIVEIRHDGTHNQLPALAVLRDACVFLLNWYGANYWEVQQLHVQALKDTAAEMAGLEPMSASGSASGVSAAAAACGSTGTGAGTGTAGAGVGVVEETARTAAAVAAITVASNLTEIFVPEVASAGGQRQQQRQQQQGTAAHTTAHMLQQLTSNELLRKNSPQLVHLLLLRLVSFATDAADALLRTCPGPTGISRSTSSGGEGGAYSSERCLAAASQINLLVEWVNTIIAAPGAVAAGAGAGADTAKYWNPVCVRAENVIQAMQRTNSSSKDVLIAHAHAQLAAAVAVAQPVFASASATSKEEEEEQEEEEEEEEQEQEEEEEEVRLKASAGQDQGQKQGRKRGRGRGGGRGRDRDSLKQALNKYSALEAAAAAAAGGKASSADTSTATAGESKEGSEEAAHSAHAPAPSYSYSNSHSQMLLPAIWKKAHGRDGLRSWPIGLRPGCATDENNELYLLTRVQIHGQVESAGKTEKAEDMAL